MEYGVVVVIRGAFVVRVRKINLLAFLRFLLLRSCMVFDVGWLLDRYDSVEQNAQL